MKTEIKKIDVATQNDIAKQIADLDAQKKSLFLLRSTYKATIFDNGKETIKDTACYLVTYDITTPNGFERMSVNLLAGDRGGYDLIKLAFLSGDVELYRINADRYDEHLDKTIKDYAFVIYVDGVMFKLKPQNAVSGKTILNLMFNDMQRFNDAIDKSVELLKASTGVANIDPDTGEITNH